MGKKAGGKKSRKKKAVKFLIVTTIIAGSILVAAHAFVDLFEKDIFDYIVKRIEKKTNGIYALKYDRVDLNLFQGSIHLKNFSINPNEAAVNKIENGSPPATLLVKTMLPVLKIEGISLFDLVFSNSIHINRLSMKSGETVVFKRIEPYKKNPILRIPGGSFLFSGLNVRIKKSAEEDSTPQKSFPVYFEDGEFTLKGADFVFRRGFYTLKVRELNFSKSMSRISLHSLELVPAYPEYRFARMWGSRTSRMSLKVAGVQFKDINLNDFFKGQGFHAGLLTIESPGLEIFRDQSVPGGSVLKEKKFPQEWLREWGFKLRIDEIKISNGNIVFLVGAGPGRKPGKIFFTDIKATLRDVANYPALLKKGAAVRLAVDAGLMGKSSLKAHVTIPINDKKNMFAFSGSLGPIAMREFNSMVEETAPLRIKSGVIKSLDFSARGNSDRIKGEMKLLYKNLKISVLKKGDREKKRRIVSFLANVVIRGDNPKRGKPPRIGKIYYEREMPMPFLSYIWKSLLTGIKSSVGLKRGKK
jgi:hypothetical protein